MITNVTYRTPRNFVAPPYRLGVAPREDGQTERGGSGREEGSNAGPSSLSSSPCTFEVRFVGNHASHCSCNKVAREHDQPTQHYQLTQIILATKTRILVSNYCYMTKWRWGEQGEMEKTVKINHIRGAAPPLVRSLAHGPSRPVVRMTAHKTHTSCRDFTLVSTQSSFFGMYSRVLVLYGSPG